MANKSLSRFSQGNSFVGPTNNIIGWESFLEEWVILWEMEARGVGYIVANGRDARFWHND